jgi:hypothetical protein
MAVDGPTPPKYNRELVEQALLEVTVDLHPNSLSLTELTSTIAVNSGDAREVRTIATAIDGLRRCGLLRCLARGGVVEPTPAALRAIALLTR